MNLNKLKEYLQNYLDTVVIPNLNKDRVDEKTDLLRELNKTKRSSITNELYVIKHPSKPYTFVEKSGVKNASNRSVEYKKAHNYKHTTQKNVIK